MDSVKIDASRAQRRNLDDPMTGIDAEEDVVSYVIIQDFAEITQTDTWDVINAFFNENGLVSQQINSYNHFLTTTIQDVVEDVGKIIVKPEQQYRPGEKRQAGNQLS